MGLLWHPLPGVSPKGPTARVAKLVDAPDLGSGTLGCVSSSLSSRSNPQKKHSSSGFSAGKTSGQGCPLPLAHIRQAPNPLAHANPSQDHHNPGCRLRYPCLPNLIPNCLWVLLLVAFRPNLFA